MAALNGEPGVDRNILSAMNATLLHRGPDAGGEFVAPGIGLAMRRLSIIDLQTGSQPIFNEDGSIVIVYNGETYNAPELRKSLEGRGHKFKTRSDTEVLVHLYEEKGEDLVNDLRGMFAFALWDSRKRKLVLARDRMGKKPLYWASAGDWLVFGSELKALKEHPQFRAETDPERLLELLALQYIPSPGTPYRNVYKLPPGHLLVLQGGNKTLTRYWRLKPGNAKGTFADWTVQLREKLEESVRMRMLSDVPVGALLSGGLDSSAIVALMAKVSKDPVLTFTVAFDTPGGRADTESARQVAKEFGTIHHELRVGENEAMAAGEAAFRALDEPILDPACLPTYLISKLARQYVTVALTGEGGDEGFAGYLRYRITEMGAFPVPGVRTAVDFLESHGMATARTAKGTWAVSAVDPVMRHLYSVTAFAPGRYRRIFGRGVELAERVFRPLFEDYGGKDALNRVLAVDSATWLADDLLQKVDRMSMAVSLEARTPLLDHPMIEFLHTIPWHAKLRESEHKRLFKAAVGPMLNRHVMGRKKIGFEPPWGDWFCGRLRDSLRSAIEGPELASLGFIDRKAAMKMADKHAKRGCGYGLELFSLYALAEWKRLHAS
jgi:asparagine synthase (glutamine-hydrolysing)